MELAYQYRLGLATRDPIARVINQALVQLKHEEAIEHGTATRMTDAILDWGNRRPREPFFVWAHYLDTHAPYEAPLEFLDRKSGSTSGDDECPTVARHLAAAEYFDQEFGRLRCRFERLGLRSRTVFIVTADHGEALGEHGREGHGIWLYDSAVRIPLIVAGPGTTGGQNFDTTVRNFDLMPTVLELAGAPPVAGIQGVSFRAAFMATTVRAHSR